MATEQGPGTQAGTISPGKEGTSGKIGSPISNEAYNVISALQAKLEGLEAYRKYGRDGDSSLWSRLSEQDNEAVRILVGELEKLVRDGKLRPGTPGQPKKTH